LASGGLGGFTGFVHPELMKYDFRLGRRNAYSFLKNHFGLPESNIIFKNWTETQKAKYQGGVYDNPASGKRERLCLWSLS
jgi:hypothetical protein